MKFFVASLIAASGLLMGSVVFEGGPNRVIYPAQHVPIHFTHDYHTRKPDAAKGVTGEGLACTFCHENISDSQKASDRDIPGHGSCDTCHADWIGDSSSPAPAEACAHCHLGSAASSQHARLSIKSGRVVVEDLGSKNGTLFAGARVERATVPLGATRSTVAPGSTEPV